MSKISREFICLHRSELYRISRVVFTKIDCTLSKIRKNRKFVDNLELN